MNTVNTENCCTVIQNMISFLEQGHALIQSLRASCAAQALWRYAYSLGVRASAPKTQDCMKTCFTTDTLVLWMQCMPLGRYKMLKFIYLLTGDIGAQVRAFYDINHSSRHSCLHSYTSHQSSLALQDQQPQPLYVFVQLVFASLKIVIRNTYQPSKVHAS